MISTFLSCLVKDTSNLIISDKEILYFINDKIEIKKSAFKKIILAEK